MKIAVLCDGAGLARLGLERAGHDCTGYELDPIKHYLSQRTGSGNCILADIRQVDLSGYDAVWASPPCQEHSEQNHGNRKTPNPYGDGTLLEWCLSLPHDILWVENTINYDEPKYGTFFNAVQFHVPPIQKRRRQIGGRYKMPMVYREYKSDYRELDICPAVMASEISHGGMSRKKGKERRKATEWYGRPPTIEEMAFHQGFVIPDEWRVLMDGFTPGKWRIQMSIAIGNGVPVYMAQAFGAAYTGKYPCEERQLSLFDYVKEGQTE